MIPESIEEWKKCITVQCNVQLTNDFAQDRLAIFQNNEHPETKTLSASGR